MHSPGLAGPLLLLILGIQLPALPQTGMPLPVPQERSAATRRNAKPVVATRPLDGMEDAASWSLFGPGTVGFTAEQPQEGRFSLRLTSPTKLDHPGPVPGRPFAETGVRRRFDGEDWTGFNRVSFQVRPHLPGFRQISLLVKFHAAGSERWSYTFGHLHYTLLQPDRWNHIVWEIPHLPRTNVTALEFTYRLQGNEPGATDTVQFDFDDLRLERVEHVDPFRGWVPDPTELAYCHLGYLPASPKLAIAAAGTTRFEVLRVGENTPVFSAEARSLTNSLGAFSLLDFSDLRTPGRYRLRTPSGLTSPFPIDDQVWRPAVEATLNHFACQRCGEAVPGIHGVCHQDGRVEHDGRTLPLNGGWHDAGDLSQGLVNTAEGITALLAAAERLGRPAVSTTTDLPSPRQLLANRLLSEAAWGLDWVHRTRFEDGARLTWATLDFWTDGVLGNSDDVVVKADKSPFEALLATTASARAARLLRDTLPNTAARARRIAEADWELVRPRLDQPGTELAAAAVIAAMELHRERARPELADQAIALGDRLLAAQQTRPPKGWSIPLSGYFHTSPDHRRILRYNHRGHDEGPVVALAALGTAFPGHPKARSWREAVRRHADYLRQTARLSAPWNLPAAGIYRLGDGDTNYQNQVREGLKLDDQHYLRRFPVWGDVRGNSGILLSQARALSSASLLLADPSLADLARDLLEWHFGRNPFAQSLMYGVGDNFTPQYSAMSGDITGGLPVGIQTRRDEDVPYWPASNCYNYAEIWVHPSSRFLAVVTDLAGP